MSDNPAAPPAPQTGDPWRQSDPIQQATEWEEADPTATRQDTTATLAHVLFGLTLGFIGLLALTTIVATLFLELDGEITRGALWGQAIGAAILFGIIPFGWVVLTRVGWFQGAIDYLHLRFKPMQLLEGTGLAIGLVVAVSILGAIVTLLFGEPETSAAIEQMVPLLTWPLILAIAITAGVGEEILFRGILQRWLGVWGQGILFGITHAGYGTVLNIVVPFAIGILFGYLFKWRKSLWTVIIAHFLYDFILLSIAMLYPDAP